MAACSHVKDPRGIREKVFFDADEATRTAKEQEQESLRNVIGDIFSAEGNSTHPSKPTEAKGDSARTKLAKKLSRRLARNGEARGSSSDPRVSSAARESFQRTSKARFIRVQPAESVVTLQRKAEAEAAVVEVFDEEALVDANLESRSPSVISMDSGHPSSPARDLLSPPVLHESQLRRRFLTSDSEDVVSQLCEEVSKLRLENDELRRRVSAIEIDSFKPEASKAKACFTGAVKTVVAVAAAFTVIAVALEIEDHEQDSTCTPQLIQNAPGNYSLVNICEDEQTEWYRSHSFTLVLLGSAAVYGVIEVAERSTDLIKGCMGKIKECFNRNTKKVAIIIHE